jgi:predicted alpha/beta-fold hydrolase
MEASYLPLDLGSLEELESSLRELNETMPKLDNEVHLHHGPNSVAIKGKYKANGVNGVVKADKTLVDLVRGEWRPNESPFHVHPFLRSGHLQTFYASASNFSDVDRVYYARKLLAMNDGGTVGLDIVLDSEAQFKKGIEVDEDIRKRPDYVKNLPPRIRYMKAAEESELLAGNDERPMLVAFHGLSGGSHESYLRAVLHRITKKPSNWAACSLNARGCGRTSITTRQLFCANWTGICVFVLRTTNLQRTFEQR